MASRSRRTKFEAPDGPRDPEKRGHGGDPPRAKRQKRSGGPLPEIDLHGCTLEAAVRRISGGLARFRATGRTTVLVITGKGYGSAGGRPVLAPGIERWLRGQEAQALGVAGHRKVRDGGAFEVSIVRAQTQ